MPLTGRTSFRDDLNRNRGTSELRSNLLDSSAVERDLETVFSGRADAGTGLGDSRSFEQSKRAHSFTTKNRSTPTFVVGAGSAMALMLLALATLIELPGRSQLEFAMHPEPNARIIKGVIAAGVSRPATTVAYERPQEPSTKLQPLVSSKIPARPGGSIKSADISLLPEPTILTSKARSKSGQSSGSGPILAPKTPALSIVEKERSFGNCDLRSPSGAHCWGQALANADQLLLASWYRAADAGVPDASLFEYRRRWWRARQFSRDDPARTIDAYDELRSELRQAARQASYGDANR